MKEATPHTHIQVCNDPRMDQVCTHQCLICLMFNLLVTIEMSSLAITFQTSIPKNIMYWHNPTTSPCDLRTGSSSDGSAGERKVEKGRLVVPNSGYSARISLCFNLHFWFVLGTEMTWIGFELQTPQGTFREMSACCGVLVTHEGQTIC